MHFLFLPPDGWAAVLFDDALPAISQASQVRSENGDLNLHQESTPFVTTRMLVLAIPPYLSSLYPRKIALWQ